MDNAGFAQPQAAEATVVAMAILGDRRAFEELVRRRQAYLRNILRQLCRNHAMADDLAQQAFIQAWKTLSSLQRPEAFGAWLRQISVNIWLQYLRRHSTDLIELTEHAEQAVAVHPSEHASEHSSERIDLDQALMQLPAIVRLCVVLNYAEGMSHREVALATNLPLGTVKSHITRGTQKLRDLLEAYR